MHEAVNHQVYSLNYIPGVGESDLECPERVWASHNILGNSTKTQGPGSRQDVLDDHFSFWNWLKYTGLGKTLARKYKLAVADRNIQNESHRGFTASLNPKLVEDWEALCLAWEKDDFPKKASNPYHIKGASTSFPFFVDMTLFDVVYSALSEAQARKELAEEEQQCLRDGGVSLHNTTPLTFLVMGLDLEDAQYASLSLCMFI